MAWNFYFQGVREDAIAALNNVTNTTGAGEQDQWNRVKPLILQELQAMAPGTVVARCSGDWDSKPNESRIQINIQQMPVLNNTVLSVPNQPT